MKRVAAWRIAWYHPRNGRWHLGLYEYMRPADAAASRDYLQTEGFFAFLVPAATLVTGHGVNTGDQRGQR